jgi:hypothetical protein
MLQQSTLTNTVPTFRPDWKLINKDLAKLILERFNVRNRDLTPTMRKNGTNIFASGYMPTHQGIAFYAKSNEETFDYSGLPDWLVGVGALADGQTRLSGLLNNMSDDGVWILVTLGLPRDTVNVIDSQKARTNADAIKILYNQPSGVAGPAKYMYNGQIAKNDAKFQAYCNQYAERINYVKALFTKNKAPTGIKKAAVVAGVVCASYYLTKDEIETVVACLSTGFSKQSRDQYLIKLRDMATSSDKRTNERDYRLLFNKTKYLINLWMTNAQFNKIKQVSADYYTSLYRLA